MHNETKGDFRKLMTSLLAAVRDESTVVDEGKARTDASALYNAGEARWGTDESKFNQVLATRSCAQLNGRAIKQTKRRTPPPISNFSFLFV